jgi:hypothetical protein
MAHTKVNMTLKPKDKISWQCVNRYCITLILAEHSILMNPAQVKRLREICDEVLARVETLEKAH